MCLADQSRQQTTNKHWRSTVQTIVLIIFLLSLTACGVVDPGERATFTNLGTISEKCYTEGLYWYNPLTTDMDIIDIKVQAITLEKLGAATHDQQDLHTGLVVNYVLSADRCHMFQKEVGWGYKETLLEPQTIEALKAAAAEFKAENIIRERAKLKAQIVKELQHRMEPYYITIKDVALTDFGFSQDYSRAIEQKQVAEQKVQQAEYERQEAVKRAEATVATAKGQAEANTLLAKSVRESPEVLQMKWIDKWNGVQPQVLLSDKSIPLISVNR